MADLRLLDDRATIDRLDPSGLLARIESLPEQCEEAWRTAQAFALPDAHREARRVAVLGMGGSAIAGDILRAVASLSSPMPVVLMRGYDVPPWVDAETLVIACSHSGNTEETLAAFEAALAVGARAVVITTGGRLRQLAAEREIPALIYRFEGEPRSAIGHQLMALLAAGERLGLVEAQAPALAEALQLLRDQRAHLGFDATSAVNAAKQLAGRLHGRLPVFVGAGLLAPAAYRWKTQVNENAKGWAIFEELPELGHNSIVGFGLPREVVARLHVVLLTNGAMHPRVLIEYDVVADELVRAGVSHECVAVPGTSALAQALSAVFLGDLVSYYLALLNGEDPSPVDPIGRLKARLAGS
jgi:glucose/mannose-6-phosphate isomerase